MKTKRNSTGSNEIEDLVEAYLCKLPGMRHTSAARATGFMLSHAGYTVRIYMKKTTSEAAEIKDWGGWVFIFV